MRNTTHAAVIGGSVGKKVRAEIVNRARELDIRVVNASAKLRKEEDTE